MSIRLLFGLLSADNTSHHDTTPRLFPQRLCGYARAEKDTMTTNKSHSERKPARQTSGWQAGPPIPGHHVRHSDLLRQLEIDSTVVQFTFQEYQLLMLLLVRSEGSYATFAQLAEAIYNSPLDD